MDPARAIQVRGGAARRHDVISAGVTRRALERAIREGAVVAHRGCVAVPGASRAAILAAVLRARPTCVTALAEWGVPILENPRAAVHLAVPRDRGVTSRDPRLTPEVVVHRSGELTGVPAVDAPRVFRDASRCLSAQALVIAADDLLRRALMERAEIAGPSARMTRWLRAVVDAGSGSPPESLARLALLRAGYAVRTQVRFDGVGAVDLLVSDAIVIEVDGRRYHSDPVAFVTDRRRDRALTALGFRVVRFAAAEVLADPQIVVRVVAQLVGVGDVALAKLYTL